MSAHAKTPEFMLVDEFMAWDPGDGRRWQLVDGVPQAMARTHRTHGTLVVDLAARLWNHVRERGLPCSVVAEPGIRPHVQGATNVRIPDLGVTCSPYTDEQSVLEQPVVLIEVLSPSNQAETWSNVWTYTTIPSVKEILILRSATIGAELLRRQPDGAWPERPDASVEGDIVLDSLGFRVALVELYARTRLAVG